MPSAWWQKGKERAYSGTHQSWPRQSGTGGGDGIVLPLQFTGTTAFDAAYVLPITIGSNNLNVSLEVDTGSSDLWVVASSCSTSACNNVPGNKRYDPSSSTSSTSSGSTFDLNYLDGQASGVIDWDSVDIGGYTIDTQALAIASTVNSEPLSSNFNGIIGLALPANSVIGQTIPSTSSNAPDGAQFTSNLFSLSPSSLSPAARFLSLTLERPGSSKIPSLFAIGQHPSESQVPQIGNGSNVHYSTPLGSITSNGGNDLFWKTAVNDITVWVNGQAEPVSLQTSTYGNTPSAILDTGVPVILSTKVIADAIYGAIGVSPAQDGYYYVDCKTPLNLTITLDNRPPISVHPLDLTTPSPTQPSSSSCIGLIQATDANLGADMILGVPFIRNTYMVMAYQVPDSEGSFPDLRPSDNEQSPSDSAVSDQLIPRLGLQGLTNATAALSEFQNVRDLGQSIDGSPQVRSGDKRPISVGLDVLFGLIGFFGFCFFLFGLRYCLMKRKYGGSGHSTDVDGNGPAMRTLGDADGGVPAMRTLGDVPATKGGGFFARFRPKPKEGPNLGNRKSLGDYELTGRHSLSRDGLPSEDALRQMRFSAYMGHERLTSEYTVSSGHTRIGDVEEDEDGEMGWRKKIDGEPNENTMDVQTTLRHDADWDMSKELDWNRDTLVGFKDSPKYQSNPGARDVSLSPERRSMIHRRQASDSQEHAPDPSVGHSRNPSASPLLQFPEAAHSPHDVTFQLPPHTFSSPGSELDMEFGELSGMVGVGTARRNGRLRSESLDISGDVNFQPPSTIEHPPSSLSTRSERGRPVRPPIGPRQSTVSSRSSISHD